jgi:ion channel-forming bestrophin family protein
MLSRELWLPVLGLFLTANNEVVAFSPGPISIHNLQSTIDSIHQRRRSDTYLAGSTRQPPDFLPPARVSYGEESRKYRRTIYTHEDWVRHRSPTRFFHRAMTTLKSGIYSNILRPVLLTTSVAVLVVSWNAVVVASGSAFPLLSLPMAPFTLSSASLGLLLVFRTNTGYSRWDEARKAWGLNINRTRDLLRMAVAWYEETDGNEDEKNDNRIRQRQDDLTALALCTWAFVRCMKRHLSPTDDEDDFVAEIIERLPQQQARAILDAKHRPNRALFDLSVAIENLPMHFLRKGQLHMALTTFEDNLGTSERLLSSPVPLFYSRHTARFVFDFVYWDESSLVFLTVRRLRAHQTSQISSLLDNVVAVCDVFRVQKLSIDTCLLLPEYLFVWDRRIGQSNGRTLHYFTDASLL